MVFLGKFFSISLLSIQKAEFKWNGMVLLMLQMEQRKKSINKHVKCGVQGTSLIFRANNISSQIFFTRRLNQYQTEKCASSAFTWYLYI